MPQCFHWAILLTCAESRTRWTFSRTGWGWCVWLTIISIRDRGPQGPCLPGFLLNRASVQCACLPIHVVNVMFVWSVTSFILAAIDGTNFEWGSIWSCQRTTEKIGSFSGESWEGQRRILCRSPFHGCDSSWRHCCTCGNATRDSKRGSSYDGS